MDVIKSLVRKCVSLQEDQIYDKFIQTLEDYAINYGTEGVSNLKSIKKNKNKIKGDLFEILCLNFIKNNTFKSIRCKDAWLYKDLPDKLREKLGFKNMRDMGIDIIVLTEGDEWYAVQCKYRSVKKYKSITLKNKDGEYFNKKIDNQVKWKDLSTFYSLCERTGNPNIGWSKYVVMTTAKSLNLQGRKNEKDLSICVGTFKGLSKEEWFKILGDTGNTIGENVVIEKVDSPVQQKVEINVDLIRQKRLLAFSNKGQ